VTHLATKVTVELCAKLNTIQERMMLEIAVRRFLCIERQGCEKPGARGIEKHKHEGGIIEIGITMQRNCPHL